MVDRASRSRALRRPEDPAIALVGVSVLVLGMWLVRRGAVSQPERAVFLGLNELPDAFYSVLWPFQQLGALLIGPVVAIVAAATRRYRLAVAALLATAAKLVFERVVKDVVDRQRPGTSIGAEAQLRGDVSAAGQSFVRGTRSWWPRSPAWCRRTCRGAGRSCRGRWSRW